MKRRRRTAHTALFASGLLAGLCAASAGAPPVVDYLFPAGGRQGTSVTVTAGPKADKAPYQVWTDHPSLKAQPAAGGGAFSQQIEKDTPPGPHLLRLHNAEGASASRVFVVGADPEITEAEPNDEVAKAQPVAALPTTFNARLDKSGDVDSYAVQLDAGQCLFASVTGRRLGAPIDPMIHLYDATGSELAFAHDGLGLDPILVYRAERPGSYVVRVSAFAHPPAADVKLAGGAAAVYRLNLSVGQPVRYAFPAAVRRGTKGRVELFLWGADAVAPSARDVDATAATADEESILIPAAGADAALPLALGDGPELTEAELKGTSHSALPSPPFGVTGRLEKEGEEDAFRFSAKKGERLVLSARSVALASPIDPVLRVEDESGKRLADDDDGGAGGIGEDALLQWEVPADGAYRALVADLGGRGGAEFVYRLSVRRPVPAVTAAVDADEYRVAPGKTASIKVTVARTDGHAGGLVAVATGLPAGVTATSAEVPEKGGEVTLALAATADAKAHSGPVRVSLLSTDKDRPSIKAAVFNLRKDAGQELVDKTDALWLTVLPTAPPAPPEAAPKAK